LQRLAGFVSLYPKTNTWYTMHLVGFPLLMFLVHFILWTAVLLLIEYREQLKGRFKGEPKQRNTKYVPPIPPSLRGVNFD
jgi:hypothetical protein